VASFRLLCYPKLPVFEPCPIIGAIASQILPSSDNGVINVLRELLGLPKQDEAEQLRQIQQSIAIQAMQEQAMQQSAAPQQEEIQEPNSTTPPAESSYP
jgi:hypothetical protein